MESTVFPFTTNEDACTGTYYTNAVPVVSACGNVLRGRMLTGIVVVRLTFRSLSRATVWLLG